MEMQKAGMTLRDLSLLQAERQRASKELQELKLKRNSGDVSASPASVPSLQATDTLSGRVSALEKQIRKLEVLTVVSGRLSEVNDLKAFINALQEICANLIGSEEIAIFEKRPAHMYLVTAWDGCTEDLSNVQIGQGIIGRVALSGEPYLRGQGPVPTLGYEQRLTTCVPLKLSGNPIGALALFRLLPQKPSLSEQDLEVLEFLGNHLKNALLNGKAGVGYVR